MPKDEQSNKMWSGRFRDPLNPAFEQWQRSFDWRLLPCVFVCLFCLPLSVRHAAAQRAACTQEAINRLETESFNIRDWPALRSFFHRYTICGVEDAEIESGVGGFVTRILVDHWETLPAAAKLFRKDPPFERFALAGINITEATDDLIRSITLQRVTALPTSIFFVERFARPSARTTNTLSSRLNV